MSAGSGILPTPESLQLVDELRKNNSKFAFGLFKVEGQAVVPVRSEAKPSAANDEEYAKNFNNTVWPAFVKSVSGEDGPRFAVVDFAFITGEGRIVKTLMSIGYCPDKGVSAKNKMTFASTKTSWEAKINIGKKYAASDVSDLEYATVLEFVSAGK